MLGQRNRVMRYGFVPLLWWMSFFLSFCLMQALIGGNFREGLNFLLAAAAVTALHFWLYRGRGFSDNLRAFLLYLIPPIIVVIYAGISMPKEISTEEYREIELGLQYPRNADALKAILPEVELALNDGKISRWEGARIRHLIFERNHILARSDAAATEEEARHRVAALVNQYQKSH